MNKLETPKAGKRRFLTSDYDFIANHIDTELKARKSLESRVDHETLWKEVDRQVMMKPMERKNKGEPAPQGDGDWRNALELGDLSTAKEVLTADVLRLIFPNDRAWMQPHSEIDFDRLDSREEVSTGSKIGKKKKRKIQKFADAELRAFMTQQHRDFGLRARVELSVKDALSHGSFVAEVLWNRKEEFKMGGVFKEKAAPVWIPHSMWNCYPETHELGVDMMYTGSMIITWEKSYEWVLRQDYINLGTFQKNTKDVTEKCEMKTYYGDITVKRKGKDIFLPNMKIVSSNKTVLFAEPMNNISIIYGGYDRNDVRDPYYLSPLVKNSPNHKLTTIIANKFLDNVDLKLEPPGVYNANDQTMAAQGGPIIEPGAMTGAKGGDLSVNFMDVGDPTWAVAALQMLKGNMQEGTGVSSPRAGSERQADRVTATQIEQEAQGGEIRTIDFVGKLEVGIASYLYISHELNKDKLDSYKYYNPEMGMDDFDTMKRADLPKNVIFEIIGSKGILMERRRAEGTSQVTAFLLGNETTAHLVNVQEVALQMYQDAGNKTPERLLNIGDENDRTQQAVEEVQAKAEEIIGQMQQEMQKVGQDLVKSEQENASLDQQLKIKGERALQTEDALREENRALKAQMTRTAEFIGDLGKLKDEGHKLEKMKAEIENTVEKPEVKESPEPQAKEPVVINIGDKSGYKITRDANGDAETLEPIDNKTEVAE